VKLAVSYARFSRFKQQRGRSYKRQLQGTLRWCRKHGYTLDRELRFLDRGVSQFQGAARKKGALSKFLKLAGTERVPPGSVLVIEDFDRLSREDVDSAWEMFRGILKAGVEIVVLTWGKWYNVETLKDPSERQFIQNAQDRAHQYSVMLSGRMRDVRRRERRRAQKGKRGHKLLPAWCRRGADRKPELWPEREAVLREMVRLVYEGLGTNLVAQTLSADPQRWPCWCKGGKWQGNGIHQLLTSPALWGAYQPKETTPEGKKRPVGDLVRDYYPAVLSEEEAASLRAKLHSRKGKTGRPSIAHGNAVSALAFDAETGAGLSLQSNGVGPQYVYLQREIGGITRIVAPYRLVEGVVLRAVQQWTPGALRPVAPAAGGDLLGEAETVLTDVLARAEVLGEQLRVGARHKATLERVLKELDALGEEEEAARQQLETVRAQRGGVPAVVLREAQSIAAEFEGAPAAALPELRRRFNARLLDLLDGVWIYRQDLGGRRAALYVQVWPKHGPCQTAQANIYAPPKGWTALDVAAADFRKGYPVAFSGLEERQPCH
jgi:DNA invertase Pin-like site-specific DNA recombinase